MTEIDKITNFNLEEIKFLGDNENVRFIKSEIVRLNSETKTNKPISFFTSHGIKIFFPGRTYDENLNEIQPISNEMTKV